MKDVPAAPLPPALPAANPLAVSPAPISDPSPDEVAAGIWEAWLKGEGAGSFDPMRHGEILTLLKPEMASFFLRKLRQAQTEEERRAAVFLTLQAGGPDAEGMVLELLTGASLAPERQTLVGTLASLPLGGGRVPVGEALYQAADRATLASSPEERMAAASILTARETDRTRTLLTGMAGTDAEPRVKAWALQRLAQVGDAATLEYLRAYPKLEVGSDLAQALDLAIAQLKGRLGLPPTPKD